MNRSRPQLFGMLAGLFLAAGLVLSSMLATAAWIKVKNSQFITVKGSTRRNVSSDLIVWQGSFEVQAPALLDAHEPRADHGRLEAAPHGFDFGKFRHQEPVFGPR